MSGRMRRAPRNILITDGHEHEAIWALRRKRSSRVGRLFHTLIGWPVAPPAMGMQVRHTSPSHEHAVHPDGTNHVLDPVCETCGAHHRTEPPPR